MFHAVVCWWDRQKRSGQAGPHTGSVWEEDSGWDLSIMDNSSHPVRDTVSVLISPSYSRLLHPQCRMGMCLWGIHSQHRHVAKHSPWPLSSPHSPPFLSHSLSYHTPTLFFFLTGKVMSKKKGKGGLNYILPLCKTWTTHTATSRLKVYLV